MRRWLIVFWVLGVLCPPLFAEEGVNSDVLAPCNRKDDNVENFNATTRKDTSHVNKNCSDAGKKAIDLCVNAPNMSSADVLQLSQQQAGAAGNGITGDHTAQINAYRMGRDKFVEHAQNCKAAKDEMLKACKGEYDPEESAFNRVFADWTAKGQGFNVLADHPEPLAPRTGTLMEQWHSLSYSMRVNKDLQASAGKTLDDGSQCALVQAALYDDAANKTIAAYGNVSTDQSAAKTGDNVVNDAAPPSDSDTGDKFGDATVNKVRNETGKNLAINALESQSATVVEETAEAGAQTAVKQGISTGAKQSLADLLIAGATDDAPTFITDATGVFAGRGAAVASEGLAGAVGDVFGPIGLLVSSTSPTAKCDVIYQDPVAARAAGCGFTVPQAMQIQSATQTLTRN